MKFYIKQKVFSWRDSFTVKDQSGTDVFFVEGELISFGKKLTVRDQSGEDVLFIKQNVFNFLPNYTLYLRGEEIATVKKEFTFFKPRYDIQGLGWSVSGDFWDHDYDIMDGSDLVASVSKAWFTWGDSYEIDIKDESDLLLAIGIVITIDAVLASERNNNI